MSRLAYYLETHIGVLAGLLAAVLLVLVPLGWAAAGSPLSAIPLAGALLVFSGALVEVRARAR
jgi:hypothetical protein